MMERRIESLIPIPSGFVVVKGSNSLSATSAIIPGPESASEICTVWRLLRWASSTISRSWVLCGHNRIYGVSQKVEQHLLDLNVVGQDGWQAGIDPRFESPQVEQERKS
jgi:hypothetical protein